MNYEPNILSKRAVKNLSTNNTFNLNHLNFMLKKPCLYTPLLEECNTLLYNGVRKCKMIYNTFSLSL